MDTTRLTRVCPKMELLGSPSLTRDQVMAMAKAVQKFNEGKYNSLTAFAGIE